MSNRRVSKEELEAFWRGDKDTYQRMYAQRMQQKADEAERQGKQVTYVPNDGSGTLPEVTVTAPRETEEQKQARLKQDYENLADNAITVAGFVPGVGEAIDIYDIGKSLKNKDYIGALFGIAGFGLPIINGRQLKNLFTSKYISNIMNKDLDFRSKANTKRISQGTDPTRELYYKKVGLPEEDSDTYYHYSYYHPNSEPQELYSTGYVRYRNGKVVPISNRKGFDQDEIWWSKGKIQGINSSTILATQKGENFKLVEDNIQNYDPFLKDSYKGYYTSESVPMKDVTIYERNPFTGHYDKKITYNPENRKTPPKTSLRFYERSPQQSNTIGTWTFPFKNNMGQLSHKTSSVTGNKFGNFIAEGSEQIVFDNPDNTAEVLKIYSDVGQSSLNDLRKFVKEYQTRNNVPFQLPTKFVGHVSDKNGLLYPVFSQQKIKETLKKDLNNWNTNIIPRLNAQMKSVGFSGNGYYTRGKREIGDIHPQNMIELSNGQFRFIDAFPEGFKRGGKL